MNHSKNVQFRPGLESLDGRALPAPLLMQACATGEHLSDSQVEVREATAPAISEIVVTKSTDSTSTTF